MLKTSIRKRYATGRGRGGAMGQGRVSPSPWNSTEPVREELFGEERLAQHARSLARAQAISPKSSAGPPLATRLKDNVDHLLHAYEATMAAVAQDEAITPAAEWLLDNYYVVEEQVRQIRDDLPPSYYRQLPKLSGGPFAGYPRVFGIAWAFVAHTDSRFDPDLLCRFVQAYQAVQPLTIGELWAVAITLRIVLIENLRRLADQITDGRTARLDADAMADRLLGVRGQPPEPVATLVERYGSSALRDTFAVQLLQRLHDQDPEVTPAVTWLHERLALQGTTAERIVAAVQQQQGAATLTVRNVITSMRLISDVDWTQMFERISPIDEILRTHPGFVEMDFATRNLYRGAIEALARGSRVSETDIARRAVAAAQDAAQQANAERCTGHDTDAPTAATAPRRAMDPGYYLLADGRRALEAAIGYRAPVAVWLHRLTRRAGLTGYVGRILLLCALMLAGVLALLAGLAPHAGWLIGLGAAGLLPAMDVAVAIVNRGVMRDVGASVLPGLALRHGIPASLRTVVAVPTLLTTPAAVAEQVERLQIHHLASPKGELYYALLSDWTDSPTAHADGDDEVLATAAAGIARLNRLYPGGPDGERFLLLHRRRTWNEAEKQWMGWERKRGKLHELNRLLRGALDTSFMPIDGQPLAVPSQVRYVITLDADTRLPRDTVRRLIGKMAHPLNRPVFDRGSQRIVDGYGILQPRVTPSLPVGHEGSLFQRISSSPSGIDPYVAAVSDVYQDLFDEGSYAGKGIYDIDAFETALAGRVPENTMLSHDLFEGIFARAGLASDIEVVEAFPARYDVCAARQHRWARGDWQLLPWLTATHRRTDLALDATGRWKMLDNLRRTLTAPAAFVALLAGWTLPLPVALVWTAFVVATIALPVLLPTLSALVPRWQRAHVKMTVRSLLIVWLADLRLALARLGLSLVFLPQQAWSMTDAIARTLFRVLLSHRHLLEWTTAAEASARGRLTLAATFVRMRAGLVLTLFGMAVSAWAVWRFGNHGAWAGVPFAVAWFASPALAYWSSLAPRPAGDLVVSPGDARQLRLHARRTWRYFETFVTAADQMLPPDNFQEDPRPVLAHRTSPTNLGLYLLAIVSAREFGWLGTLDAIARLEATLATMQRMPRCRGHFYNWYDTQDLRPLEPRYVSSVDSGNLAGHLIAVGNACRAWAAQSADAGRWVAFEGIRDNLALLCEAVRESGGERTRAPLYGEFDQAVAALQAALADERPAGPATDGSAPAWPAIMALTATVVDIVRALADEMRRDQDGRREDVLFWGAALELAVQSHCRDSASASDRSAARLARLTALTDTALKMADAMEFGFLLDPARNLLSIGYAVTEGRLDPNSYDLLASEARLASFIAIAKGDIPARHWFRLGRVATPVAGGAALVSWSGSMFEYLMPSLVMRAPASSLIARTNSLVVRKQISYGATLGLPWGISESAYNARDLELTYQYSSFGIPDLGLQRGLGYNAVIAPYATALAAMVAPSAAARNFERLGSAGAGGRFGFYEALDYTPARVPEGQQVAVVRAFMAHHQGMSIASIANALLGGRIRTFFHAEPAIQATELLLQERTPGKVAVAHLRVDENRNAGRLRDAEPAVARRLLSANDPTPATHLLSNGRYAVMLTAAGSGYSRWNDLAVTRWREDATRDDWGSYLYLRDVESGEFWSATWQPTGVAPDSYEVTFAEDRAEFVRRDGTLTTSLDVLVSAEDDAEVRRITVANTGARARTIELTSYAEIVLAPPAADQAHPAFSKLFIETEYLPESGVILATRRRREPDEPEVWAAHLAVLEGDAVGLIEVETDRARFIGRGRGVRSPLGLVAEVPLGNSAGVVLDAAFAMRQRFCVQPGATASIAFWTIVAESRAKLLDLVDKHRDGASFARAAMLVWTQAQVQLRHNGVSLDEASQFQRIAGSILYSDPSKRPSSAALLRGMAAVAAAGGVGAAPLWAHGVSGDLPVLLVRIDDIEQMALVRQLVHAHEYWRMKRLAVDLVIVNERAPSYVQDLQAALETLVRSGPSRQQPGGAARGDIFVLRADLMSSDARALFPVAARVVLAARNGRLLDQLQRLANPARVGPPMQPRVRRSPSAPPPRVPVPMTSIQPGAGLECFNGLGGFANDGREYVTILGPGQCTPMPWVNVIANPACGFLVSAEGSGYTWVSNSREHQLTPWSNDPVSDPPAEAFYVRDDDTGALWGPQASPVRDNAPGAAPYIARHGQGYSRFTHTAEEVALELVQFVPLDDPLKVSRLTLHNLSNRRRRLSVTAYAEWALGASRSIAAPHTISEIDPVTGAMFARNGWSQAYRSRVAFADLGGRQTAWSADRREFIGRNGTLSDPAALAAGADALPLSGKVGAALDPCAALQTSIELEPGGIAQVLFLLGEADAPEAARQLIARYREADLDAVLADVTAFWDETLGTIQVATPDRTMDLMLNRWLLYQTLVCRIWARAGFYQASGAYGFRDQLQDGMALAIARPALTREHLLRAAARQFPEGDVQHWWLPQDGAGVRTRISDDRAWLAYTVAQYVDVTGDLAILDVALPFIEGRPLAAGERDAYFVPTVSEISVSLYEHCVRALEQSLGLFGVHDLPLMGTGDWNDGMNRVGEAGRGESVWLGWFLYAVLSAFAPLARMRGDGERADRWIERAQALRDALESAAWDGEWYRRGYFDDGTPLGAASNGECTIDSIAQSWSVLSGAASAARAERAMAVLDSRLLRRDDALALLFTPPFDRSTLDPGYIKGYPPGIRENGGQYTHAAVWSVLAFAQMGDGDRAAELFALLNPVNRSRTRSGESRYKVEPYVVAADVYSVSPHVGRGGWTWYTGSAGWLYRAGIEGLLGICKHGKELSIQPCVPKSWSGFNAVFGHGAARYDITVRNPQGVSRGVSSMVVDGIVLEPGKTTVQLVDDGERHSVIVTLGAEIAPWPVASSGDPTGEART